MPSIKGTSSVTDPRARSKALKATKFPSNFSTPVNLSKVNKPVLTQWIEQRVTTILGFDDEIVSSTAINLLLPSEGGSPDPRRAQLDLVGFLGEDGAASFAKELWSLLLESQSSISGIPRTLLEQKKKEISSKTAPRLPPNMQPASNRNPEMNRFVQEAARRAQVAREMVEAQDPPPAAAAAAANVPVHIPVSPLHPSEQTEPKQPPPTREEDRKMSPRVDRFGRQARTQPPPSGARPPSRGRYEDGPRRPYASARSSRSRDRGSQDRTMRRGGSRSRSHEDDRRRRRGSREGRRYYDEDDEIQDLDRRLSDLKRQSAKRRDDLALDEEIEDVKDKIYELERRRRRNRRRQEDEEYYRRKNRRRRDSPEASRRRSSRSPDSEDYRRRRRSRSRSHDRRRDRSRDSGRREEDPPRDQRETVDNRSSRRSKSRERSYSSSSSSSSESEESKDSKESK
jgi:serine/arginine repetitive matrix protein 1